MLFRSASLGKLKHVISTLWREQEATSPLSARGETSSGNEAMQPGRRRSTPVSSSAWFGLTLSFPYSQTPSAVAAYAALSGTADSGASATPACYARHGGVATASRPEPGRLWRGTVRPRPPARGPRRLPRRGSRRSPQRRTRIFYVLATAKAADGGEAAPDAAPGIRHGVPAATALPVAEMARALPPADCEQPAPDGRPGPSPARGILWRGFPWHGHLRKSAEAAVLQQGLRHGTSTAHSGGLQCCGARRGQPLPGGSNGYGRNPDQEPYGRGDPYLFRYFSF